MNTRTFLKSLATIAVAPQILIPRLPDAYHFVGRIAVVNPDWVTAPYEIYFMGFEGIKELRGRWQFRSGREGTPSGIRYNLNTETRIFERVQ